MLGVIVDCALYHQGRRRDSCTDLAQAITAARAEPDAFVWIGLHEPTGDEFQRVTTVFELHPLAVEDALKAHQRPKLETYPDTLFLVLKPVRYDAAADTVHLGELAVFVGDSFVVTVRHGATDPLDEVRRRLENEPEVLRQGPTAVLYAVADAVVDRYIEVAAELQADLETLETEVFTPGGQPARRHGSSARQLYGFKRQVLEFRRATLPLAEPMSRLASAKVPYVHQDAQPFFRDVSDHLTRANEHVEGLDRLVSDVLSAHLAQMGVQQNDDMRRISAWAAMAAVPTMIAGIYGMNFTHMPELHWVWGYPAVIGVMVTAVLVLRALFKRNGWL